MAQRRSWRTVFVTVLALLLGLCCCADVVQAERPASITVVCDDNYPPYIFRSDEGQIQGILVDQWRAWEKATGVRVDLVAMDWVAAQQYMREGRADVIETIFFNEERAKTLDFTKPYARLEVPVFVHKTLGGIGDVQSLRGFTVGVKAGDAVIGVLKRHGINALKEYASYRDIINAARTGDIRVFSIDAPPALYYLYKLDLESEFRQTFVLYTGEFHRAVRKGDAEMLRLVESGFAAIPAGELKDIEEKWLGAPIASRHNLRLLFSVLGSIAAAAVVLAAFNFTLRRRVRAKTAELAATLARLRESEERFRAIFNSVNDFIFIHDVADGSILDVNQSACEAYGYAREEMRRMGVQAVSAGVPPYTQHEADRFMSLAMSGQPQRFEWLAKARDGRLFWVEASVRLAQLGGREHLLVSARDINERKRAEEALRASENTLRSLFASMTDVILILDAEGRYLDIAPTNVDRLFKPPDELLGRSVSEVFPPEQADYFIGIIGQALKTGTTVSTDYHMEIGGRDYWFCGNVSPLSAGSVLWVARDITERKKAEEALLESRERLQLALDAANDGLWDWRLDTGEAYFSPRYYTMLGYEPGEFAPSYENFTKLLHPDDLVAITGSVKTALKDNETNAFEIRMRAKSGEWKWILTRSRVVDRNAAGAPARLAGTHTDITERKKAEEALARKDALLQAMLRNLPFDFWARDSDQRIIMQSDESVRLWGDLSAGQKAEQVIDPRTLSAWEANNRRVLAGEVVSGDREYVMASGEARVFHDIVAPIRDADAVLGILGVNIDITDRKLSEEALRESEERYRTLFEQSLDAMAVQEGLPPVFTWVNRAFCELFGYAPEEVYAFSTEDIWRMVHPEDRDLVRASLTDRLAGRQDEVRYGFRIVRKNGEVRWVDVTGRRMSHGARPMNLSIYRDITERKMYEEALTQARDAADAANRAKSEFLANMSHEIRTPLNGIVGMIQLLDGSALDEEQKRYAQAALQSSQRLTGLLGDILDLSRIEARKFVLEQKPFVLADILDSVDALYRLPAGQKGVELSLRLDQGLPRWLSGDEHRLRQILFNLVGNAVKFTHSGRILVEVDRLGTQAEARCRVLFVVSDTGVGIPAELLDQTFQMFTQVEGSLNRSHQGAGLGLAIVRHLVTLMGGSGIDVSSELGQGTTFSFVLPFGLPAPGSIEEAGPSGSPSGSLSGNSAGTPSLKGLRVLLVEDEEINQLALRTGLERRGLLVSCAENGEAALAALRAGEFDCVLMDIQMPGMSGLEVTRAIRTRPEFQDRADIPVIALTAFAMAGDRERFLAAGMDDYLAKPFTFEDLARILGRVLGRIRRARLADQDARAQ
ncbi:MAG: PAS domain S-box protein [Humidesulfovibrio sp.]